MILPPKPTGQKIFRLKKKSKNAFGCGRDTQKVVTRIRAIDEDRTEKTLNIEPETYLQWSKDGQALYFNLAADNAKNVWRQSLSEETEPRQITNFDKEKIFRFAASPDGKTLACIRYTVTFDAVMLSFDE
jgi:Tol biopolymer transport system component